MKKLLLLTTLLFCGALTFAQSKKAVVCHGPLPATQQFAMLAASNKFVIAHKKPLPLHFQSSVGKAITYKTADGKTTSASTPEELLIQQWRWHLPVSNLQYWIRGLPVPNMPSQKQFDAYQRLSQMQQDHWYIQYSNYTRLSLNNNSSVDLPTRIAISSPDFKTKIVIYSWKIN